ncbi:MAG: Sec-independent protein translocase protein TatB [Gammaproteobacteria bacterium]|nr:Sec-independent protein translocase protein TatB [Gammaproteobacteria bacterium]MDH5630312.1 Sec-independent protein translocase protein TatB [Gammaproteobacteria bacterium]
MFDISFLELFVVGVIALIVLGPERLPRVARSVGRFIGKAKRSFNSIAQEIDRELQLQDIQRQLDEQKAQMNESLDLESVKDSINETQNQIHAFSEDLKQTGIESGVEVKSTDKGKKTTAKPKNSGKKKKTTSSKTATKRKTTSTAKTAGKTVKKDK